MSELGRLVTELQVKGVCATQATEDDAVVPTSDHRALQLGGTTVMVPVHNNARGIAPA